MGAIRHLTTAEYHAEADHLSKSKLNTFCDSSQRYYDLHVARNGLEGEPSWELILGDLVDQLLFAPEDFGDRVVEIPRWALSASGKRMGKCWEHFKHINEGKYWVDQSQMAQIRTLAERLQNVASGYLSSPVAYSQVSIFWTCPRTRLRKKCRPDLILQDRDRTVGWDLKVTESLSRFRAKFKRFRYWMQDVHYREGIEDLIGSPLDDFVFSAIEATGRHRYGEFRIDEQTRYRAESVYQQQIDRLLECYRTGDWGDDVLPAQTFHFADYELR